MKTCTICKIEKILTEFEVDKRKSTGRGSRCKKCFFEYLKLKKRDYRRSVCLKCGMNLAGFPKFRSGLNDKLCIGCDGSEQVYEEITGYVSPFLTL